MIRRTTVTDAFVDGWTSDGVAVLVVVSAPIAVDVTPALTAPVPSLTVTDPPELVVVLFTADGNPVLVAVAPPRAAVSLLAIAPLAVAVWIVPAVAVRIPAAVAGVPVLGVGELEPTVVVIEPPICGLAVAAVPAPAPVTVVVLAVVRVVLCAAVVAPP